MTHLSFPNGVCAHVFVSWLHPFKEQKLVVVGSEGMAVFHDNQPWESKIQHYAHKININADGIPVPSKADVKNIPIIEEEPLKIECKHFIDCIASGEVPEQTW